MNLTEINSIKDQVARKHGYENFDVAFASSFTKMQFSIIDNIIAEAMYLYAESQKPKWISVKDELPDFNVQVLTWGTRRGMNPQMGGCSIHLALRLDTKNTAMEKDKYRYVDENDFAMMDLVTHWQPLPEAPLAPEE